MKSEAKQFRSPRLQPGDVFHQNVAHDGHLVRNVQVAGIEPYVIWYQGVLCPARMVLGVDLHTHKSVRTVAAEHQVWDITREVLSD